MAKKKKTEEKKIVLDRVYNVPLRKEFLKSAGYKRSKKAMRALREFLVKHMKSDKIKIGRYANMKIWEHGIKNPPHHIKISAKKDEEGKVIAELVGAPVEKPAKPKKEVKKEEKKELDDKVEKSKDEKAEEAKEIQKEEIKELKREHPKQHAPKKDTVSKNVQAKPSAPAGKSEMRKP